MSKSNVSISRAKSNIRIPVGHTNEPKQPIRHVVKNGFTFPVFQRTEDDRFFDLTEFLSDFIVGWEKRIDELPGAFPYSIDDGQTIILLDFEDLDFANEMVGPGRRLSADEIEFLKSKAGCAVDCSDGLLIFFETRTELTGARRVLDLATGVGDVLTRPPAALTPQNHAKA